MMLLQLRGEEREHIVTVEKTMMTMMAAKPTMCRTNRGATRKTKGKKTNVTLMKLLKVRIMQASFLRVRQIDFL